MHDFLRYYGKFVSHWGKELWSFGGEQVVGVILAVLILVFQLREGIIPAKDVRATAYATILWPYIALIGIYVIIHLIRTPWVLDQENQEALQAEVRKREDMEKLVDVDRPQLIIRFYAERLQPQDRQMYLFNCGKRYAFDVSIDPIRRGSYEAFFPTMQVISSSITGIGAIDLKPVVSKDGQYHTLHSRNGVYLCELMREGASGALADTIWVPVTIRFSDAGVKRVNTCKIMCERPELTMNVGEQTF